ncbi:NUDIX hydrolase [Bacillus weihaiensis]|uniref:NUDIX hydrolase n=1 Tax=Bacillus weihaiensis TaxID=1547283 RepID=UPI0023573421|nr:NUDIX hydrolase [Bacillus weihaiensis]
MSEQEMLRIYDDQKNDIGVATRSEVHRKGYWHEAFHCWLTSYEQDTVYLYLQLRSKRKKDYPNLLDITAAGHLVAHETVEDGIREIKEEIGIDVSFDELIKLGVLDYCVIQEDFIDKELANVFLHKTNKTFDDFILQLEEVSGMVKVKVNDFADLWYGVKEKINMKGFEINEHGERITINEFVSRERFVPHQISFYKEVIQKIQEHI